MLRTNRISNKILRVIVLFCVVAFVSSFVINVYLEYSKETLAAEENIESIKGRNIPSLSRALWSFDVEQVKLICSGIMNVPGVTRVDVRDEVGGLIASVGEALLKKDKLMSFDLTVDNGGRRDIIGKASIFYNVNFIEDKIVGISVYYIVFFFLFVFLQGGIIFVVFHRRVSEPLVKISAYASGLTADNLDEPLRLQLDGEKQQHDELADLVDAINAHRERLAGALEGLQRRDHLWEEAEKLANLGYFEDFVDEDRGEWSPGLYRIQGVREGDVAPSWTTYQALIHPVDVDAARRWRSAIVRSGGSATTEHSIVRPDGNIRRVRVTGMMIAPHARSRHRLLMTIQDITESYRAEMRLRESEADFRGIFDNIAEIYYRVTMDGIITTMSPSVKAVLGYAPDELIGKRASDLIFDEAAKRDTQARVDTTGGLLQNDEVVVRHADGRKVILEIRQYFHCDEDGNALARVGVARDVTERHHFTEALRRANEELELRVQERTVTLQAEIAERQYAEKALRELNDYLEQRVHERTRDLEQQIVAREQVEGRLVQAQKMEAVGQLAGGIAHDFNNILTVIQGNLEWLEDRLVRGGRNKRSLPLLRTALEAVGRSSELTQRLLAFSRRSPLRVERVDVRNLVSRVSPLVEKALREAVELVMDVEDDVWSLDIDAGQLENSILNLAINARDAMPNGGRFTIEVSNCTGSCDGKQPCDAGLCGDAVRFAFTDTGTGMAPEVVAKAFNPFFTTKEKGKGTGLGLSMVYGFVAQSRGDIRIESEVGKGTTIVMCLPRASEAAGAGEVQVASGRSAQGERMLRILVVEDDASLRPVMKHHFDEMGHEVMAVEDARTALDVLAQGVGFDILVTDIVMPRGMNGIELCEAVEAEYPHIRVILMTGYAHDAFEKSGRKPEEFNVLFKPFGREQLVEALDQVMKQERPKPKQL